MAIFSRAVRAAAAVLLVTAAPGAVAQTAYPSKPVRIVVPYPPGGGADILARAIGQKLSEAWHQPVIIENKAGAGGSIGTESVARSAADGYTMLMASPSHPINATLYKSLSFNTARDFAAVALVASGPLVLVVNPSTPVNSVKELIALAKARPGQLSYASAGTGSSPHLAGELFKTMADANLVHVPYKGTAPALSDLMGGQVQAFFAPVPTILQHVRTGKLKALGVTTARRFAALPDVPTIAEAGLPGYEVLQWWGLVVPSGTSKAVLAEQHAQVDRILSSPEMRERLVAMGADPGSGSPEQFDALIRDEIAKWAKVIEAARVTAE
jgi:tripartite-type tricarboxylate transporter receptor subunit TctC